MQILTISWAEFYFMSIFKGRILIFRTKNHLKNLMRIQVALLIMQKVDAHTTHQVFIIFGLDSDGENTTCKKGFCA